MNLYDRDVGLYPGTSPGNVIVTGSTSFAAGFGVSLYDPHELEHDLYLSSASPQIYGEYGFAYTVTIHFPSTGATLSTVPLVDVYALSDPSLGDFPDNAGISQQDAASVAIFQAATRLAAPIWSMAATEAGTTSRIGRTGPATASSTVPRLARVCRWRSMPQRPLRCRSRSIVRKSSAR